jgi:multiple sugar transport system permease protein/sn-glycerol 3-phosphate transport system permease protein
VAPDHHQYLFVLIPVLIVFFLAQRQLIEGIARGAVKG